MRELIASGKRAATALWRGGPRGLRTWLRRGKNLGEALDYQTWIARHDAESKAAAQLFAGRAQGMSKALLITLIPAPIDSVRSLNTALQAARAQIWPDWELLLTRSHSSPAELEPALAAAKNDARIRLLPGSFSNRTSAWSGALDQAQGAYLCWLEDDAVLRKHALLFAAEALASNPSIDLLFADHDQLDQTGARHTPFFKPRFHPELLWSLDPFGPFALLRTSLARKLGLRLDAFPVERFELLARAVGTSSLRALPLEQRILGLPFVLSSQRDLPADESRRIAASAACVRISQALLDLELPGAKVLPGPILDTRSILLSAPSPLPKVSAIIPTRDGVVVLRRCVEGLLERTDWTNLELLIVDNGSQDLVTLAYLEELQQSGRAKVLRAPGPFNFSRLNNLAAREASGELLAFLNDDLEILEPGWLTQLAAHALRPEIGAVGARLLYPDGRVQHAGVATGVLGLAGHLLRGLIRSDAGPHGWAKILRGSTVVTGACLLVRRALFLESGGFDEEQLAVAFNDVDLCLRLAQRGFRNLYVPAAELIHHESWSRGSDLSPERRDRFAREMQTMLLRWPDLRCDPLYSPNLTLASDQMQPGSPPRLADLSEVCYCCAPSKEPG